MRHEGEGSEGMQTTMLGGALGLASGSGGGLAATDEGVGTMAAAAGAASELPYIGCRMSLISKLGVRYEGTLHSVDTDQGQLALTHGSLHSFFSSLLFFSLLFSSLSLISIHYSYKWGTVSLSSVTTLYITIQRPARCTQHYHINSRSSNSLLLLLTPATYF